MIVDYEWNNGKLLVSYVDEKGKIKFKNYPFQNPHKWVVTNDNDPQKDHFLKTWDRKPVKKVRSRFPDRYSIYEYFHDLPENERNDIFAYNEPNITFCDIEVEITQGFPEAHLAENKVTAISLINKDKILLLGIKDLTDREISKMEKDVNEYFKEHNTNYKIMWEFYRNEEDMLRDLFQEIIPSLPVITGWNFVKYDWVYLVTRARKLGLNPEVSSPTGKLVKPWRKQDSEKDFKPIYEELPKHRVIVDYMDLYDKWDRSVQIRESSKLDYVAEQMLSVKKLEFEGSLKTLYEDNYYDYMLYNCIDTVLVQLIHYKSRLFDIMLAISNIGNIEILQAPSAIRVTEGLFFKDYYDDGIIMCKQNTQQYEMDEDDDAEEEAEKLLKGGYVKFPTVGIYMWISVFDYSSLYPTTMRQYNIGPETYKGMKINDNETILNGIKLNIDHEIDIITDGGAIFSGEIGVTNKRITALFAERKSNKNESLDYIKQASLIKHYIRQNKDSLPINAGEIIDINKVFKLDRNKDTFNDQEMNYIRTLNEEQLLSIIDKLETQYNFYNALQNGIKLALNSIYGAFGNAFFVCSTKEIANAITLMARNTIKMTDGINEDYWYNKWHLDTEIHEKLGITKVEPIPQDWIHLETGMDWKGKVTNEEVEDGIYQRKYPVSNYIDTDSLFVGHYEAIKRTDYNGDLQEFCMIIARERLEPIFLEELEKFAIERNTHNLQNFELENINESILFIAKKKYIKHTLWEDGRQYRRFDHLSPKGVTLIQSGTPKFAREKLEYILKEVIFDKPLDINIKDITNLVKKFRQEFEVTNINDIAEGTKVNDYWSPGRIKVEVKDPKTKEITGYETIDAPGIVSHWPELIMAKGTYFSRKAAGLYNHLLSGEKELQNIYPFIEDGDTIKYYPCYHDLNDKFAYPIGEYPKEFAPPVNYEDLFEKTLLKPLNSYLKVLDLPEINKKLRITFSLFN